MVKWLLILCLFTVENISAQNMKIAVSAASKKITVLLDDDNSDKTLMLDAAKLRGNKNDLMVCSLNWKTDADMNRKFMLYTEDDNAVADLDTTQKKGIYTLPLSAIINDAKPGATLDLYTIAIPKNPAKAAVVKVRRVLVCKIKLQ